MYQDILDIVDIVDKESYVESEQNVEDEWDVFFAKLVSTDKDFALGYIQNWKHKIWWRVSTGIDFALIDEGSWEEIMGSSGKQLRWAISSNLVFYK